MYSMHKSSLYLKSSHSWSASQFKFPNMVHALHLRINVVYKAIQYDNQFIHLVFPTIELSEGMIDAEEPQKCLIQI